MVTARRGSASPSAFIWLALVIGIDGSLLIAQLTGPWPRLPDSVPCSAPLQGQGVAGQPGTGFRRLRADARLAGYVKCPAGVKVWSGYCRCWNVPCTGAWDSRWGS